MSSFNEFKQNRRIEKIMKFFKPITESFSSMAYFLWILVPLIFLYFTLKEYSYQTSCDKVTTHKQTNYQRFIYVENGSDDYYQIKVDSTEYSNFLMEYTHNRAVGKETVYCYEEQKPSYYIYPCCMLVSIVIFLFWSSFKYDWN